MESMGRTAGEAGAPASYLEGIMGYGVVGDGATAEEAWADAAGWSIYHSSEAGCPDRHVEGWYYQPDDFDGGDIYSPRYETREEAVEAMLEHVAEMEAEARR